METIRLNVPNISCDHCVTTIQRVVGELAGVIGVRADASTKLVDVTFRAPATRERIVAVMTEWGYPPAAEP
jgi:copper chaperone